MASTAAGRDGPEAAHAELGPRPLELARHLIRRRDQRQRHRVRRPATSPGRREAPALTTRLLGRQRRGALRNAAAAAKPPRACARAAERSSSAATSSSGVDAACAPVPCAAIWIELPIGRIRQRAMNPRSLVRLGRAVHGRPHKRMTERHPRSSTNRPSSSTACAADSGSRALSRPPHKRRIAERLGRRQQAAIVARRVGAVAAAARSSARSRPTAAAPSAGRTRRRAAPASVPAVAPGSRADRRASRRRSVPAHARRADPAAPSRTVPARRDGREARPEAPRNPRARSIRSRAAKTIAILSARRRRATNASTRADARSSHCASSTTQSSGCSSAASDKRLRTASPTRNGFGARPALRPSATSNASRCGSGSPPSGRELGEHNCWSAANASSISTSTPTARTARKSGAADRVLEQGRLSDARLAVHRQHAAVAVPRSLEQAVEHVALALPAEQLLPWGRRNHPETMLLGATHDGFPGSTGLRRRRRRRPRNRRALGRTRPRRRRAAALGRTTDFQDSITGSDRHDAHKNAPRKGVTSTTSTIGIGKIGGRSPEVPA